MTDEEADLWGCASCTWVIFLEVSKKGTYFILKVMSEFKDLTLQMKALYPFERSSSNYPTTRHNYPEVFHCQYQNRFKRSP